MGLVSWIIFGALAGWVASLIAGNSNRQGCLMDIIVGVIGAFLGGLIMNTLGNADVVFGWNWQSFGVAVLGAVILLFVSGANRRSRRRRR